MKQILVATDGSDCADRAVDFAGKLAADFRAELLIANVIGGYGLPGKLLRQLSQPQNSWLEEMFSSASADILRRARDRLQDRDGTKIKLESRSGDVAQSLLDIAEERDIDMIVVGKRGANPVERMLIGSVSQKLVNLAQRPVTVVP